MKSILTGRIFVTICLLTSAQSVFAASIGIFANVCTYLPSSTTACPNTQLFTDYNASSSGPISLTHVGTVNTQDLSIDYTLNAVADIGVLQAYASSTVTGVTTDEIAYVESRAFTVDSLTINGSGPQSGGFLKIGFNASAVGQYNNEFGFGEAGFWYYAGLDSTFQGWFSENISNTTFDGTVWSHLMPFDFNVPFNVRTTLLARVDSGCSDPESFCSNWSAEGTSDVFNTLEITSVEVLDEFGNPINGTQIVADSGFNYSSLTAVPIPGAIWLFGSGLLGLIGMAKRKRAT